MRRAALLATLLLAAGCGGDSSGSGSVECPQAPPAVDACDGRSCFEACGVRVAIDAAPVSGGFEVIAAPTVRPFTANRVGQGLLALVPTGLQLRDGETAALEGALTLGGTPTAIAEAEGTAFVATATGVIYPLSATDPAHPIVLASWRPEEPVALVPADNRRLILRTPNGVSVLDVGDPSAPSELACLPIPAEGGMDRVWYVTASAGFVAAAGGDTPRVWLYDLLRPDEIAAAFDIDDETTVILHKELLVITSNGRLIAYNAVPDVSLSERTRADLPANVWDPPVIGGFAIYGDVALDLENDLQPYDVIDSGGATCTISVNAQDHSASYFLAPGLVPDRRFQLSNLPALECGPRESRFPDAYGLAHEPAGARLLVSHANGTSLFDPTTNAKTDGVAVAGYPAWVGSTLVGITATGTDFGMPLATHVTFASVDDPTTAAGDLDQATAFLGYTADDAALYLLVEGQGREYGSAAPEPSTHQVLRFDPAAPALTPVTLPSKAAPVAVAAGAGRLWYLDDAGKAVALDTTTGTFDTVARGSFDFGVGAGAPSASALGLFFNDACGGLTWIDPNGKDAVFAGETPHTLLGADATHVYTLVDDAPANTGLPGIRRLVASAPNAVGDGTFTLAEVASQVVPDGSAAGAIGTPIGLAVGGVQALQVGP
ncbi:MAG: hypothetical protein EP329_09540 [Deltaproteobacteria bacterium]|nr:MAG: hypothetical protein EP329_09540 [Deltaproteobacteria bacterium]